MDRILLVAEPQEIEIEITHVLSPRYHLDRALTGEEARQKIQEQHYSLILIATTLPDTDGFQLCTLFRSHERTQILPIILIDNGANLQNRTTAFTVGANDLVKMPLNQPEFYAQVTSMIQFRKLLAQKKQNILRGPYKIDFASQKVFLETDFMVKDLLLTTIEFKLFMMFMNHESQVLTRDQIRAAIWGESVYIETRSIDKHVSTLRRKLSPYEDSLQASLGLGYIFSLDHKPHPAAFLKPSLTEEKSG